MTVQWSAGVRNAVLDAWETAIGATAKIEIRTGAQPANTAAAATGTVLATFTLAADWSANAASGTKSISGLPITVAAAATGTAGHYRITDNAGTTCHEHGSVTATGGGGDATIDNVAVVAAQNVSLTAYSKTAPHP